MSFCLLTIVLINKNGIRELTSDVFDLIIIASLWFVCFAFIFYLIKSLTKRDFAEKTKLIYWTIVGGFSLFHWIMIKHDPYPYDGPIDSILKKDIIQKSKIRDSLESVNGKADSTIEYTYSIDTAKQGVYIWFNGKAKLLRKLTEEEIEGGQMRDDLDKEAVKNLR